MPDAVLGDEMLGEKPTQHPGAAGDQNGSGWIQLHRGGQHDLAGMHSLAHVPEGLPRLEQAVGGSGQGLQGAGGEQLGQGGPCLPQAIRFYVGQVEGLVGDPGVGRGDIGGRADVGLADLGEPPTAGQQI